MLQNYKLFSCRDHGMAKWCRKPAREYRSLYRANTKEPHKISSLDTPTSPFVQGCTLHILRSLIMHSPQKQHENRCRRRWSFFTVHQNPVYRLNRQPPGPNTHTHVTSVGSSYCTSHRFRFRSAKARNGHNWKLCFQLNIHHRWLQFTSAGVWRTHTHTQGTGAGMLRNLKPFPRCWFTRFSIFTGPLCHTFAVFHRSGTMSLGWWPVLRTPLSHGGMEIIKGKFIWITCSPHKQTWGFFATQRSFSVVLLFVAKGSPQSCCSTTEVWIFKAGKRWQKWRRKLS